MFYCPHCKDSRVNPVAPKKGLILVGCLWKGKLLQTWKENMKLYLLDESSAVRSRNNYYHNLIRVGRVVSLYEQSQLNHSTIYFYRKYFH